MKKKIVVTGGAGFIGSAVVKALQLRGEYDIMVPRSRDYDLREKEHIVRLFNCMQPDAVIHLAGIVGGIGANRARPGTFFYDNAIMGIEMIEEARKRNIGKFVCIGTICSYPKFTPVPFREETLWDGYPEETNAPYGLAKRILLVQAQAYRAQYEFNAIYLLPVNTYGPRDNFNLHTAHVIPALIRKFSEARARGASSVTLWGDGSPTREFLYVTDAAEAIVLALENYDGAAPVNIGSGQEISIRDLAVMIAEMVGFRGTINWDTSKPNGQLRRCLDTSRAKEHFGFQASTPLVEGLQKTIDWYVKHVGIHSHSEGRLAGVR